ncbi:dipeptide ABC transporter ATP-binding protein [Bifidobacterium leontopitheci]|uniref:ABC transporter n=1 Tax=Bifidobacterium leontopitheci TaxID=2650774 RepID=A0A6I1GKS0_9BIFI|nr:ABC transporter ATP-binding protein [Bifidobacterium leontopitheci]KAB7790236.1 ABC transporter [Bifidobacterium leontopitheci]
MSNDKNLRTSSSAAAASGTSAAGTSAVDTSTASGVAASAAAGTSAASGAAAMTSTGTSAAAGAAATTVTATKPDVLLSVRDLHVVFPREDADSTATPSRPRRRGLSSQTTGGGPAAATSDAAPTSTAPTPAVVKAVDGVTFDIPRGKVTCIVGESGSGKSVTAMSMINLIDRPGRIESGSILFEGRDVLTMDRKSLQRLRGEGISMIFQEPMHSLNPVFTIGKQIVETIMTHRDVSKKEAWKQSVSWLERVGLPNPERIMDMYPHELSGGMVQRAMIAIALSCEPKLLIADEPTTALDVTIQAQIIDLLLSLKAQMGLTILFITHDFGVVAEVADEVVVMYEGHIMEQGDVTEIFDHPTHPYTKALLATRPVIGRRQRRLPTVRDIAPEFSDLSDGTYFSKRFGFDEAGAAVDSAASGDVRNAASGQQLNGSRTAAADAFAAFAEPLPQLASRDAGDPSAPLLEVRHLKKYFTSKSGLFGRKTSVVRGVNDVSLTIQSGETVGLVGESGSGKTTLGQTILRLQGKTDGDVRFRGRDVFAMPAKQLRALRPEMQYIFQDPYSSLNPRLPVIDAIGEPMLEHGLATKDDVRDHVTQVLEICGLNADALDRYPHEFSGGQRQRIGIARAMALRPDFVVADEPVASLDVSIQAQIINLFSDLQEIRKTAFLFISHDLSVVEHLCERIVIMYLGVVVETGSRDELFNNPLHPYTKELLDAIPVPNPRLRRTITASTRIPDGDPAAHRPYAAAIREGKVPELHQVNEHHWVADV